MPGKDLHSINLILFLFSTKNCPVQLPTSTTQLKLLKLNKTTQMFPLYSESTAPLNANIPLKFAKPDFPTTFP